MKMNYKEPDSRKIFCTGVVQQAASAGVIKNPEDLYIWVEWASIAYDRWLGESAKNKELAALEIIEHEASNCNSPIDFEGNPFTGDPSLRNRVYQHIGITKNSFAAKVEQILNQTEKRILGAKHDK